MIDNRPPRSHGWLYRNVSPNPLVPVLSGYVVCPEGVRPGELIKLAGWPREDDRSTDGGFTIKARALTAKEEARQIDRAVKRAGKTLEAMVAEASDAGTVAELYQAFRRGEAWIHMTKAEQAAAALTVGRRLDAIGAAGKTRPSETEERTAS
tara:strand:+ start:15708 stop:16163 length:456 start_codon:yes stop_codon:yes gene_type:complete